MLGGLAATKKTKSVNRRVKISLMVYKPIPTGDCAHPQELCTNGASLGMNTDPETHCGATVPCKRRSKENIGPILVEGGHLANRDEEKAGAFNAFFASVFNNTDRPWAAQSPEAEDHECGNSDFPFVDTEIVRDQLYQLNVHKAMGPDGIHPRVLKELADVMAGPLSIIYQRSWESGEVPADWNPANIIPIYKNGMREDPGNYRPVSLTSVPGKIMEKIILATIERHLKNNAIIRHSQHWVHKGKGLPN
ncbi:hypothetical protein QYF61_019466 [Mycteria americana]|uniref:RNA-directed DNA polymerase from mobile element jockey n=1 Tax=Mycteria americana TaxID=33587 RepID=A0AAN7PE98_MYCAM|nr:hypothetical protein QYF61_019466 [Mycteria americana]